MGMDGWGKALSGASQFGSMFNIAPGGGKQSLSGAGISSGASAMGGQPSAASTNPFAGILPTLGNVSFGDPDLMKKYQLMQMQQKLSGGGSSLKDLLLLSQIEKNKAQTAKYLRTGGGRGGNGGGGGNSTYTSAFTKR